MTGYRSGETLLIEGTEQLLPKPIQWTKPVTLQPLYFGRLRNLHEPFILRQKTESGTFIVRVHWSGSPYSLGIPSGHQGWTSHRSYRRQDLVGLKWFSVYTLVLCLRITTLGDSKTLYHLKFRFSIVQTNIWTSVPSIKNFIIINGVNLPSLSS